MTGEEITEITRGIATILRGLDAHYAFTIAIDTDNETAQVSTYFNGDFKRCYEMLSEKYLLAIEEQGVKK